MAQVDQASSKNRSSSDRMPARFRFAGVHCGIKESGNLDLALVVCDQPAVAAGVYTQNQIVAAPVLVCRDNTPSDRIRAVVTNSGNANACTGQRGMDDALEMCRLVADQLGCRPDEVLVMSTGVIGQHLPMDAIRAGIESATNCLGSGGDSFSLAADAICTTDRSAKSVVRTVHRGEHTYTIAGMAKGAGMIAPNMATMLAMIMTDAPISQQHAHEIIRETAEKTFNRVSVDGHTSTNDTLLLLSTGSDELLAGDDLATFTRHVEEISTELAIMMVADGEGASHVMAIRVEGAASDDQAEEVARTVAASPLVKTAITGGDPNWGRIVSAAGYAKATIQPDQTCLKICDTPIYDHGAPVEFAEADLSAKMQASQIVDVELRVGDGSGSARFWSSDLTTEYVTFNSEYTT